MLQKDNNAKSKIKFFCRTNVINILLYVKYGRIQKYELINSFNHKKKNISKSQLDAHKGRDF